MLNEEKIKLLRQKIRQLQIELNECFRDQGECCGLTLAQCHTLTEIGYRQPVALVSLASGLGLDPSTLSRSINGLVLLGLVNRSIDEKDRRYVVISLTEQGEQVFSRMENFFNTFFTRILELIPPEKREGVVEAIGSFAAALHDFNQQARCCPETVFLGGEATSNGKK